MTISKNKLVKNIGWTLYDRVIKILGGLFVGIWVANYLGSYDYGLLSYSLVYQSIFMFLIDIGITQYLVKVIIDNNDRIEEYIGSANTIKVVGALIAFILSNTLGLIFIGNNIIRIMVLILSLQYFTNVFHNLNSYFQSRVEDKYRIIAHTISFVLGSLVKVYLILIESNAVFFVLAYVSDFILAAIIKIYFYKKVTNGLKLFKYNINTMLYLLKYSWTIGLTFFLSKLMMKTDKLMIGSILNESQVGIYSVVTDLTDPIEQFNSILTLSIIPYLMHLHKNNIEIYKIRIEQLLNIITYGSIIVCIVFMFNSELIYGLLYNDSYQGAVIPFKINIWNFLIGFQFAVFNIWLINQNLQRFQLYTTICAVILNIILNYYLIQIYGLEGASTATLISRLSILLIFPLIFRQISEMSKMSIKSFNPLKLKSSFLPFINKA